MTGVLLFRQKWAGSELCSSETRSLKLKKISKINCWNQKVLFQPPTHKNPIHVNILLQTQSKKRGKSPFCETALMSICHAAKAAPVLA